MSILTRQSLNFSTSNPLIANGIFAPQVWDDLLEYSSIIISINCSGAPCVLTVYQSSDRVNVSYQETISIYPNELYNNTFQLYSRFFKLEIQNTTGTSQTSLNCQVLFKQLYPPQQSIKSVELFNPSTSTGVEGVSSSILINKNAAILSIFGNLSDTTILTLQFSNDNVNFYDSQYSLTSSGGDFGFSVPGSSLFYCRLKSSNDINILAIINY